MELDFHNVKIQITKDELDYVAEVIMNDSDAERYILDIFYLTYDCHKVLERFIDMEASKGAESYLANEISEISSINIHMLIAELEKLK